MCEEAIPATLLSPAASGVLSGYFESASVKEASDSVVRSILT
jgi:hypothetical protein